MVISPGKSINLGRRSCAMPNKLWTDRYEKYALKITFFISLPPNGGELT